MNDNKDRIIKKIKALLAKDVENGATEAEANSAMQKAKELMTEYYVSQSELEDPFVGEKCEIRKIPRIKSGYDLTLFFYGLKKAFDCELCYTKRHVTFFGFNTDVDLCEYFYLLITKATLNEAQKYKQSRDYRIYKRRGYSGRTLVAEFIRGFLVRIEDRLIEMYEDRNSTVPRGMGLVLVKKEERVKREFELAFTNLRNPPSKNITANTGAYLSGKDAGDNLHIKQGIDQYKSDSRLSITS